MVDLKTLVWKTSVDPKLLKNCLRKNQKERAPKELSEEGRKVFAELMEHFGLLFAGDKIGIPKELKKKVVEALHFGQPDR